MSDEVNPLELEVLKAIGPSSIRGLREIGEHVERELPETRPSEYGEAIDNLTDNWYIEFADDAMGYSITSTGERVLRKNI